MFTNQIVKKNAIVHPRIYQGFTRTYTHRTGLTRLLPGGADPEKVYSNRVGYSHEAILFDGYLTEKK